MAEREPSRFHSVRQKSHATRREDGAPEADSDTERADQVAAQVRELRVNICVPNVSCIIDCATRV